MLSGTVLQGWVADRLKSTWRANVGMKPRAVVLPVVKSLSTIDAVDTFNKFTLRQFKTILSKTQQQQQRQ